MKIVALSDMHGTLDGIEPCDVVCIAGDIVPLRMQRNIPQSHKWLKEVFIPWCNEIECDHVVLVAGNHDFYFDESFWGENDYKKIELEHPENIFKQTKVIYLKDSGRVINGKKFYGTPWATGLPNWAFYKDDDSEVMKMIPACDVLITHAPPQGKVGTVLQQCHNYMRNFGSEALWTRLVSGEDIKYCLSGHIHSGQHTWEHIGDTRCINVSVKDENYRMQFYPVVFEI